MWLGVTTATASISGFANISSEFAIMFILAMIVMYDAMGVRRSAGLHAREINRINRIFAVKGIKSTEESPEKKNAKKKKKLFKSIFQLHLK